MCGVLIIQALLVLPKIGGPAPKNGEKIVRALTQVGSGKVETNNKFQWFGTRIPPLLSPTLLVRIFERGVFVSNRMFLTHLKWVAKRSGVPPTFYMSYLPGPHVPYELELQTFPFLKTSLRRYFWNILQNLPRAFFYAFDYGLVFKQMLTTWNENVPRQWKFVIKHTFSLFSKLQISHLPCQNNNVVYSTRALSPTRFILRPVIKNASLDG